MTPEEADARRLRLESLSRAGGPLTSRSPQASVSNPEWYGSDGRATPARAELHKRLLNEYEAESPEVPQNRQAVIIVGPPGAGKSSVRDDIMKDTGTTPAQWRHLDPDDFRDRLAGAMRADGSLNQVVPPEAADLRPTPRELSSQLFVESAKLTQAAQKDAITRGDNLMIEGAYADEKRLGDLVKSLEKQGYDVQLATVDVSPQDAQERAEQRYRDGASRAAEPGAQGKEALGGRFVPAESLAGHFDEEGRPKATGAAQAVAAQRPGVQSVRQYSVSAADQPARLQSVAQRQGGMQQLDAQTYKSARAAGMMQALPSTQLSTQPSAGRQGGQGRGGQGAGQGERPEHRQRQQQQGGPKHTLDR
ncbi:MAG TPA: zeta toxin family protein [Kribbella sp.]